MVKKFIVPLGNWLLPRHCVLCHHETQQSIDLCAACEAELPKRACRLTALQSPTSAIVFAPFTYQSPIKNLILQFKFQQKLSLAPLLSHLMAKHLRSVYGKVPSLRAMESEAKARSPR